MHDISDYQNMIAVYRVSPWVQSRLQQSLIRGDRVSSARASLSTLGSDLFALNGSDTLR